MPEAKTHLFDFKMSKWFTGPDLQYSRYGHACGLYKIRNKSFAFVVGGNNPNSTFVQSSAEMLNLENGKIWKISGKEMK